MFEMIGIFIIYTVLVLITGVIVGVIVFAPCGTSRTEKHLVDRLIQMRKEIEMGKKNQQTLVDTVVQMVSNEIDTWSVEQLKQYVLCRQVDEVLAEYNEELAGE
jgi:hypothetical protein